jgi:hypothetical protein
MPTAFHSRILYNLQAGCILNPTSPDGVTWNWSWEVLVSVGLPWAIVSPLLPYELNFDQTARPLAQGGPSNIFVNQKASSAQGDHLFSRRTAAHCGIFI